MAETGKKTKAPAKPKSAASKTTEVTEPTTAAAPAKPKASTKTVANVKEPKLSGDQGVAAETAAVPVNGSEAPRGIHLEEWHPAPQPTREQIAQLAHRFWKERGGHHGSHEQDWLRAERELRGMAS